MTNTCRVVLMLGACIAALPALAGGWNWGDDHDGLKQNPEFAKSQAICRKLDGMKPPPADRPSPATRKSLAGCDAIALYYGLGRTADPRRARRCAFVQAENNHNEKDDSKVKIKDKDKPLKGISLLMTIYANGVGADRDLDLATSLACRLQDAPAAVNARVMHLQRLKTEHWSGHDFDYCDDLTRGDANGLCAARDAAIVDKKHSARLARLTQTWTPAERRAFAPLDEAAQAYAQASGEREIDHSAATREAMEIRYQQRLRKNFTNLLRAVAAGDLAAASAADYRAANDRLDAVYRDIMAIQTDPSARRIFGGKDSLPGTTVGKRGIRNTQRLWVHYRDAWVDFAAVKYPGMSVDRLKTALTRRRINQLESFLPNPPAKQTAIPPGRSPTSH